MDESLTNAEECFFRVVLLMTGRDPEKFAVNMDAPDVIRVQGPAGTATYTRDDWMATFGRQLHGGHFEGRPARTGFRGT